ncbi:MAG: flagellar hook-basal body complex protein FliE [Spirochaetes bacterium RBG_16_49_21]|nr:MAG: flagellar hook-basal body complex protein FliE [Spirochaetes bacterium RBG_16_49_21]
MNTITNPAGNVVTMKTTNPLHYDDRVRREPGYDDVSTSFADSLMKALGKVNLLQVDSEGLQQKMIYEPESVDIHSVMIAMQKAEVALSFTKAVRDEALRAYRELINLR